MILISMRVASRRAWDARTMTSPDLTIATPGRNMTSMKFMNTDRGLETCEVTVDGGLESPDSAQFDREMLKTAIGVVEDGEQPRGEKVRDSL